MPDTPQRRCPPAPPAEIRAAMAEIFQARDARAMDLFRRLKGTVHLVGYLHGEYRKDGQPSSARMRLLVRLAVDDRLGHEGILPSELSKFLGVSRNTVSSLLNGLEEQGLIERQLDPTDRRQFLIRITSAGDEMVRTEAPKFAAFVSNLFSALSADERETLLALLDKLLDSLVEQAEVMGLNVPGPLPGSSLEPH